MFFAKGQRFTSPDWPSQARKRQFFAMRPGNRDHLPRVSRDVVLPTSRDNKKVAISRVFIRIPLKIYGFWALKGRFMIRKIGAVGLCAAVLAGCAGQEQERTSQAAIAAYQDDARCRGEGVRESSPKYPDCRRKLKAARNASAWSYGYSGH